MNSIDMLTVAWFRRAGRPSRWEVIAMMSADRAGELLEVQAIQSAYCHAIDRCDAEAWADLFHPDRASSCPNRPTLRGTAELRRFLEEIPRRDFVHLTLKAGIERVECNTIWA